MTNRSLSIISQLLLTFSPLKVCVAGAGREIILLAFVAGSKCDVIMAHTVGLWDACQVVGLL